MVFGLALAVALPWLVPFVFGHSFAGSVLPAVLLVVSQLLLAQGSLLEESLRAQNKPFYGVLGMVVTIGMFGVSGAWLAPRFGVAGAAGASIFAQLCFCIFMCRLSSASSLTRDLCPGLQMLNS